MERIKNVLTVGFFAIMPVLILLACQTTPAENIKAAQWRLNTRNWQLLQKDVNLMLNKSRNLAQYQMKKATLD